MIFKQKIKKTLAKQKKTFLLFKFISYKTKSYLQAYIRLWHHYAHVQRHLQRTITRIKTFRHVIGVNFFHLFQNGKNLNI